MSEAHQHAPLTAQQAVDATRTWLEQAVIGLNLCPFAKAVHVKGQVHYVVSEAADTDTLLALLRAELLALADADPEVRDTTLVIAPYCLADFLDFNDFLEEADQVLEGLELDGVLQIADFHPRYQFAGSQEDDVTNSSNRAPFPTLHLLREDSIDRAVEAFPEAEAIFDKNMQTLSDLGSDGWARLAQAWQVPGGGKKATT